MGHGFATALLMILLVPYSSAILVLCHARSVAHAPKRWVTLTDGTYVGGAFAPAGHLLSDAEVEELMMRKCWLCHYWVRTEGQLSQGTGCGQGALAVQLGPAGWA